MSYVLATAIGAPLNKAQESQFLPDRYLLLIICIMTTLGLILSAWRFRLWWFQLVAKKTKCRRRSHSVPVASTQSFAFLSPEDCCSFFRTWMMIVAKQPVQHSSTDQKLSGGSEMDL